MPKPLLIVHRKDGYFVTRSTEQANRQSEGGKYKATEISKIPEGRTLDLLRKDGKTVTIDETAEDYSGYEGPTAQEIDDWTQYL